MGASTKRPDFLQICKCQPERLNHGCNIHAAINRRRGGECTLIGEKPARPLPECGLFLDVCEQGASNQGKDGVDVGLCRLRQNTTSRIDLLNIQARDHSFADGPDNRVRLIGICQLLSDGGKPLSHSQGKGHIDGEGEPDAGRKKGTSQWIKNCGVDEARVRRQGVMGDREVSFGFNNTVCEAADCARTERISSGTKDQDHARVIFFRRLKGTHEVCCRNRPNGVGSLRWNDSKSGKGSPGSIVRSGNEELFSAELRCEIGKDAL